VWMHDGLGPNELRSSGPRTSISTLGATRIKSASERSLPHEEIDGQGDQGIRRRLQRVSRTCAAGDSASQAGIKARRDSTNRAHF
jgi:hypothetical protein